MKTPILSVFIALCALQVYGQQPQKTVSIEIDGHYASPKVSPNLDYILMAGVEDQGLFLYSINDKKMKKISSDQASTFGYSWDLKGDQFYFLDKETEETPVAQAKVKTYNLDNESIELTAVEIEAIHLPSFNGLDEFADNQIVVYNDLNDFQIYTLNMVTREIKAITNEPGHEFFSPILSHDKTKVSVQLDNQIYIYSVDNSFAPYSIGEGIATEWSADDKYILSFLDESKDGHEISGSEVYLIDLNTGDHIQVTHTEDQIELFPTFYGNNNILYTDDKTGNVKSTSILKN